MSVRPTLEDIEAFLYKEATLLDQTDLDGWLDLYTQDATYWMPLERGQGDPMNQSSLIYEDRNLMEVRKRNISHHRAPSKQYPIRSTHIISNIQVRDDQPVPDCFEVTSNFIAVVYYRSKQLYAGTYLHVLQHHGDDFRIQHKRVDLIDSDGPLETIITYL